MERDGATATLDVHARSGRARDALVRAEHHDEAIRALGRDIDTDEVTASVEQERRRKIAVQLGARARLRVHDDGAQCRIVRVAGRARLGKHAFIVGTRTSERHPRISLPRHRPAGGVPPPRRGSGRARARDRRSARVGATELHAGALSTAEARPTGVDPARRHVRELGHPAADVRAVGVEPLALRDRVEDAKARLRVDAAAGRPLPAEVVRGPVAVGEVLHVVRLAAPVVDEQVLGEEARRDHARAVVHEALGEQLARRGVDDGVAGRSRHPRVPRRSRPRATGKPSHAGGTAARAPRASSEGRRGRTRARRARSRRYARPSGDPRGPSSSRARPRAPRACRT